MGTSELDTNLVNAAQAQCERREAQGEADQVNHHSAPRK
jgi:hypothetical protein